jgi:hypothetical protein
MIVKIELHDEKEEKFLELKKNLGISANTEVINFTLNRCYQEFLGKGI